MHITTPIEPTTALWDGLLEPPVVMRSDAGLAATIGRTMSAPRRKPRLLRVKGSRCRSFSIW